MTCIVGIENQGKVYIGGDVQGSSANHKIIHTQPKVFSRNGVIFGYTSSYRFGQLIEHEVKDPFSPPKNDVYRWLVTCLIPSIKMTLESNGYTEGGTCLIGVHDELWRMENDFSVLRSVRGYDSVGSGNEYALGALHSASKLHKGMPRAQIENAVSIANSFCPTVGKHTEIVTT